MWSLASIDAVRARRAGPPYVGAQPFSLPTPPLPPSFLPCSYRFPPSSRPFCCTSDSFCLVPFPHESSGMSCRWKDPPLGVRPRRLLKDPPRVGVPCSSPWAIAALWSQLLGISTMILSRERECGMSPGSHSELVLSLVLTNAHLSRNMAFPNSQLCGGTKVVISVP